MTKENDSKVDKRIQKTRKLLSESLISLILEKGYESVSVQDILVKANVGRSTFYFHYENKEQLFLDGFRNLNIKFFESKVDQKKLIFLPLISHIAENANLAKALLGKKGGDIFFDMLKYQVADYLMKSFKPKISQRSEKRLWNFNCLAAASAVLSLIRSWIDDQMSFSAEQISLQAEHYVKSILV